MRVEVLVEDVVARKITSRSEGRLLGMDHHKSVHIIYRSK
jgi:hypothetical protein